MPPHSAPSAAAPAGGLVVVTVDRLPAWMLSAWGATWVSTPAFDGLAAAGVTLDRLIATSVDPRDTLAAIDGRGGLWSAAASAGWRAALVTDDPRLPERRPGVDVVEVPAAACGDPAPDVAATNLARLFTRVTDLVGAGNHRLVWCHAGSLGVAWDAPLAFRDAYADPEDPPPPRGAAVPHFHVTPDTDPDVVMGCRQAFAGQLTLLDACLAPLVGATRSLQPSWAFALVGLRGMPLGLHGEVGCGSPDDPSGKAYGEWVHLPAILVAADSRMAGQRYGGLAVPADLGATLVDLAVGGGRPAAADPAGDPRSLAGLFAAWTHEPRERVVVSAGDGMAIATDGWHLVIERTPHAAPRARLFAKPDDFFELSDVADRCPRVAEELASALGPGGEARVLSAEARGP